MANPIQDIFQVYTPYHGETEPRWLDYCREGHIDDDETIRSIKQLVRREGKQFRCKVENWDDSSKNYLITV